MYLMEKSISFHSKRSFRVTARLVLNETKFLVEHKEIILLYVDIS